MNHQPADARYMWAITMLCGHKGRSRIHSLAHTRSEAIRNHERECGKFWPELRRQGDRCVRVLVSEVT